MPPSASFDVVVVGAGPAGSATAHWLARRGWRVGLLERTRFEAPRIGESLSPGVQVPLRELGLWSEFLALSPLPSWGTRSVWGDAAPSAHSHLVSPFGCGWHVNRLDFDRMLARGAVRAGAVLFEGVALRRSRYDAGRWRLQATEGAGPGASERVFDARLLVDATGRTTQVGRARGGGRLLFDRLVGVAVHWAGADTGERGHLLVESAPDGWWYSAPLPSGADEPPGRMIAMLMTDADLCARLRLSSGERWHATFQGSRSTRERLERARQISAPRVYSAVSQRLRRSLASDDGPWLAVGDAELAVDPLSGSGVVRALRMGRAAADAATDVLQHPDRCPARLAAYDSDRDEECTRYLFERAQYYAGEQRFDTAFWRRRTSVLSSPAH